MPQALPPSLAALLARDDFVDAVFEAAAARTAWAGGSTIFDTCAGPPPRGTSTRRRRKPKRRPAFRARELPPGLDFQPGRVNEKAVGRFDCESNFGGSSWRTRRAG